MVITNQSLSQYYINQKVRIFGWASNFRKFKDKTFIELRDYWGIVQVVVPKDIAHSEIKKESVISVYGTVVIRSNINNKIPNGNLEIIAEKIELISPANELPFEIQDDINANEDLRLEYRFLDLRRNEMKQNLIFRYKFIHQIRQFLYENDFVEIETPILSKSTPEGARSFIVPTRKQNHFFALPQSPQLYKQLLMVSGFNRYFQFARAFRDEDLRKDRQFEFTQLDMEFAFPTIESIQKNIEQLVKHSLRKFDFQFNEDFPQISYKEAIDKYGSDKPDLRFKNYLIDASELDDDQEFLFSGKTKVVFLENKHISKQDYKILSEIVVQNKANRLLYIHVKNANVDFYSFKTQPSLVDKISNFVSKHQFQNGTLFIVSDSYEKTTQSLGALRNKIAQMYDLIDTSSLKFAWIIDWPMFEKDEETQKISAAHHPFTMVDKESVYLLDSNPLAARAQAYDLVLNGFEIGGGSIRIVDKKIQEKIFKIIGLSEQEAKQQFGFLLKAFSYGVPPHGGFAFGLDRFIMILRNASSIRDVIAFPVNSKGQDMLLSSPTNLTNQQLQEYFIQNIKEKIDE
ncbi:aspartate--tRNA ligase [Mesomycoplasma conjunctivae]|uniref:aspartate--tRNA ligase n=1 Tax=Mesomycoplasma conjunctivae TaxID=45361 RepID=UPI003DA526F5